jgi:hypothetical protein
MKAVCVAVVLWIVIGPARAQCSGCQRIVEHDPIGPLPFGVTVVYTMGGDGHCEPSDVSPPCFQVTQCEFQQIDITLSGVNGKIHGYQLASLSPVVYMPYERGPT